MAIPAPELLSTDVGSESFFCELVNHTDDYVVGLVVLWFAQVVPCVDNLAHSGNDLGMDLDAVAIKGVIFDNKLKVYFSHRSFRSRKAFENVRGLREFDQPESSVFGEGILQTLQETQSAERRPYRPCGCG